MNNCAYLQWLCNKYGDFKVAISSKNEDGSIRWSKHRSVMDCWEKGEFWFLEKANHRSILPIEIVLDMDEKPSMKKVNKIINDLHLPDEKLKLYFTGSKGYHIHIMFHRMLNYNLNKRNAFRLLKCKKYNCDEQKIEGSMIAVENMPHWKTGNKKELIDYGIC